jgi:hypothetical protein
MYCLGLHTLKFTFLLLMKFCIDYSVNVYVHTSVKYIICNCLNKSSVTVEIYTIMHYLVDYALMFFYLQVTIPLLFQSIYYEYMHVCA